MLGRKKTERGIEVKTVKFFTILVLVLILTSCAANRARIEQKKKDNCERNQQIKIAIFPFKNDDYGATDEIINRFYQECFQIVERSQISKIAEEMKIQDSGLTESNQQEIGKILNVNAIIVGSVYTINVPYYPTPAQQPPPGTNDIGWNFGQGLGEGMKRALSGTTVYANFRIVDVRTGRILKVFTDQKIRKIQQ